MISWRLLQIAVQLGGGAFCVWIGYLVGTRLERAEWIRSLKAAMERELAAMGAGIPNGGLSSTLGKGLTWVDADGTPIPHAPDPPKAD